MIPATTAAELIKQSGLTLSPEALSLVALVERHLKPKAPRRPSFDALAYLLGLGVEEKDARHWLHNRASKKPTQRAIDSIADEAAKVPITMAEAIRYTANKGWMSFEAGWYRRSEVKGYPTTRDATRAAAAAAIFDGGIHDERIIDITPEPEYRAGPLAVRSIAG